AFKVKITKDGDFTRMNILKISNIKDAKKTKVKVEKEIRHVEEPEQPPLILKLNLMPDAKTVEELLCLVERHPGKRPLELHIKSKLADVIIESKMKVSELILEEAKEIGVFMEESLSIVS
ncbi:MAG: hypothetical protein GQ531_01770, partial [Sulfurovum sp.]|nr:hypothetical protein [Sulfurovum sp.]